MTLICKVLGTPVRRKVPLYSPLVKGLRVLQAAHLTKGKKRVRRAKLTYLLSQNKSFRIP